jgi:hypothetical protein
VIRFTKLLNLEDYRVMTPSRAAVLTTWPSLKFGALADESEPCSADHKAASEVGDDVETSSP